jgi:hypothetical protein
MNKRQLFHLRDPGEAIRGPSSGPDAGFVSFENKCLRFDREAMAPSRNM